MSFDLLSVAIGFCTALILTAPLFAIYFVKTEKKNANLSSKLNAEEQAMEYMQQAFSLTAQEVLDKSSERFLTLAQEKMKQAQSDHVHDVEKKQKAIADIVDPIDKKLKEMNLRVENLDKAGVSLSSQLKNFAEDQRALRQETQNLVRALRNPNDRGKWGEMQLQRALEMIGMVEGTHFIQQKTVTNDGSTVKPDFVIKMPGEMQIVVDVKAPIEPYWDALEGAESEADKIKALGDFRKKVREHLKHLSNKEYWQHFDTPEFVVMFLPTESLYSTAVSNDPSLIEDAAHSNVILASPTTMMGLLRVIWYGWQQSQMADEAKNIAALGTELFGRFSTFGDHLQKVGKSLTLAVKSYNASVSSLEKRVMPSIKKLQEKHIQTGGKELPDFNEVDTVSSDVTSPELLKSPNNDLGDDGPDGKQPKEKKAS